jgi:hypothetical protein
MGININQIYLLCRCTKREYAEDMFYNGNLFFNYPVNWIRMEEEGNEGQGDSFEGVYSSIISEKTKKLRNDSEVIKIKGRPYLRSKEIVEKWPGISFYSVSELTKGKKENDSVIYDMAKDYIESFSNGETFKSMLDLELKKRTAMVIILNTGEFFRRLRSLFNDNNLVENRDFFMRSVIYRPKNVPFVYDEAPYELIYKEGKFKKQHEFRIILNPNNPNVRELFGDGQKINIGPMDDFAVLKTNFYNGAKIVFKDNVLHFEGTPWQNMFGPLNEWDLKPLLEMIQYAYHTTTCVLDGKECDAYELWVWLVNLFASKYNIEIRYEAFVDGEDDKILLLFHGDDYNAILKNEDKDSYYYIRKDNSFKAPFFEKLYGGHPSGMVRFSILERNKTT